MHEYPQAGWRVASKTDEEVIVRMCLALNQEDPGSTTVSRYQVVRTLKTFRKEPVRGCALVAEIDGQAVGYALLVSFWSNELGGEVCVVDEIYIIPERRRQRLATRLIESLRDHDDLCSGEVVALGLEVAPGNRIAREFFIRQGFTGGNTAMHLARRSPERRDR